MIWKKYCFIICLTSCFWFSYSHISDEEYALMPNVFEIDNYDSCMLLKNRAFYCAVNYELKPLNPQNPPKVWKSIKETSASDLHYRHDLLRRFVCVPKSCPNVKTFNKTNPNLRKELNDCFDNQYRSQGLHGTVEVLTCRTANPLYKIDTVDWIVAIVVLLYICLVLASTAYDWIKSNDSENYAAFKDSSFGKMTVTFSIMSNWKKLRSIPTGPDAERLKPVQGIRVVMSIIVIMVHAALAQVAIPIFNTKDYEDMNDFPTLTTEIPKRAQFMLSFHFMMSSWMLTTSLLAKIDRNEIIDIIFVVKSIIKRYIRFIFTFAVVVAFYATWFRHIPFGPFFDGMCEEVERCRQNWWTNMLFIHNHYNRYYMCHIISWYLAVEMHYYIIALVLLMIVLRRRMSVPFTVGFLLLTNIICTFLDHKRHGYPSSLSGKPEEVYRLLFNQKSQWHDHFASYHANSAGFIVGIGFGYVYHYYKNQKIFTTSARKAAWPILSLGLIAFTLVLPQVYDVDASTTHSAIWVAITRPIFAIGMGIFVLGLTEGLGGWVKDFLSWNPMYPLGKLSFCVYVGHTIFQHIRGGLMRSPGYLGYYSVFEAVSSDVLLSFLGALWLTIFFEMPSNELANNLFGSKKKGAEKKTK